MVEHGRRDEIEIVGAAITDQYRGIERHRRVIVNTEVDVVWRFAHRHVDRDNPPRNLERGDLAQRLDVIEHTGGFGLNQLDIRFFGHCRAPLAVRRRIVIRSIAAGISGLAATL